MPLQLRDLQPPIHIIPVQNIRSSTPKSPSVRLLHLSRNPASGRSSSSEVLPAVSHDLRLRNQLAITRSHAPAAFTCSSIVCSEAVTSCAVATVSNCTPDTETEQEHDASNSSYSFSSHFLGMPAVGFLCQRSVISRLWAIARTMSRSLEKSFVSASSTNGLGGHQFVPFGVFGNPNNKHPGRKNWCRLLSRFSSVTSAKRRHR